MYTRTRVGAVVSWCRGAYISLCERVRRDVYTRQSDDSLRAAPRCRDTIRSTVLSSRRG